MVRRFLHRHSRSSDSPDQAPGRAHRLPEGVGQVHRPDNGGPPHRRRARGTSSSRRSMRGSNRRCGSTR